MYIQSECTVQMYTDYAFCLNIMANKSIPAVSHVHKNKLLKNMCYWKQKKIKIQIKKIKSPTTSCPHSTALSCSFCPHY